jgi:hypothetical protein
MCSLLLSSLKRVPKVSTHDPIIETQTNESSLQWKIYGYV